MPDQGGISTSMYPTGSAAPPDPLGMMTRFAYTQNMLNQNAMFQQEYRARQALGPILQSSIDPTSGELDIGQFLVRGAADPNVAWKMPEITLQMIQRKYMQAETAQVELKNAGARYAAIGDAMGGLYSKALDAAGNDPSRASVSHNDMISAVAPLIGMHRIESKDVMTFLNGLASLPKVRDPESGQMVPDPKALAVHARQWADTARGVTETLKSTENAITPHPAGGQTLLTRESPRTGAVSPAGTIQSSLTPEQLAERVEYQDPRSGETKVDTLGNMLNAGVPASAARFIPPPGSRNLSDTGARAEGEPGFGLPASQQPPLAAAAGTQGATPAPSSSGAGPASMAPAAGAPPSASGGGGPGAGMPQGVPGGAFPLTSKLNPADQKALEGLPKYAEDVNTAGQTALRVNQVIDEMEQAARNVRGGGGGDAYLKMGRLLQALGANDKLVDQVANKSLPWSQVMEKLQLQLGTSLMKTAVTGTGRAFKVEFDSFQKQNPNLETDPRAMKEMFGFLRRMSNIAIQQAQALPFMRSARGDVWTARNFEPWWQDRVVKSGQISLGSAKELGRETLHPAFVGAPGQGSQ
jgi:hypothetical protein